MDAVESTVLGVISNVLTGILAHYGTRVHGALLGEELALELKRRGTRREERLAKATSELSEELDWEDPNVHLFLGSSEVESILRQIFSTKIGAGDGGDPISAIRHEFRLLFNLHMGWPPSRSTNAANTIFEMLLSQCEIALDAAIDEGVLSAHEARSSQRFHVLRAELSNIEKNLALLTGEREPALQDILKFEDDYRRQVAQQHKFIVPPDFDRARKVPIERLYVTPSFVRSVQDQDEKPKEIELSELAGSIHRSVLLGDPGSGKSTFASKLVYEVATAPDARLMASRRLTPVHVTLRQYGAEKKKRPVSLLEFIERQVEVTYQLPAPPIKAFEYLLLNGRIGVIFDGLDELLDTHDRQIITADIEAFCRAYPAAPVLVTSRKVGYEQAPLDPDQFQVYQLAPFAENEIEEYVKKWFGLDKGLGPAKRAEKVTSFMKESAIVPDLRSNPLLLALMCNIYRGEGYIPRNRPDVYQKCAEMLFERWDKRRGIDYPLEFEAHIRPTMMHLAHWIYVDESRQSGVTETELIRPAAAYLSERRFEDQDEAEHAARAFIRFCRDRAWVFTDTGTTKAGERLYQFTHKTFLEYFTAAYLVRVNHTPADLYRALEKRIKENEWDVVSQLAFQLQHKRLEGAGDELLAMLVRDAENDRTGTSALAFAARCLEFMVVTPGTRKVITQLCTDRVIEWRCKDFKEEFMTQRTGRGNRSLTLLAPLVFSAKENRVTVGKILRRRLEEYLNAGSEDEACIAFALGRDLFEAVDIMPLMRSSPPPHFWKTFCSEFASANSAILEDLMKKYSVLCQEELRVGNISIEEIVEWHGVEALYLAPPHPVFRYSYSSILYGALSMALREAKDLGESARGTVADGAFQDIAKVGKLVLTSRPSFTREHFHGPRAIHRFGEGWEWATELESRLAPDVVFGLFAALAPEVEAMNKIEVLSTRKALVKHVRNLPYSDIWSARMGDLDIDSVTERLEGWRLADNQAAFVLEWVRHDFHFFEDLDGTANFKAS